MNRLYYGDNLRVLRDHIASDSVDLVYLDPPFNSNATYNVLFKAPDGTQSHAQIEAFEDSWHWNESAEDAFDQVKRGSNSSVADMLVAMRSFLGENDMMAYLSMMAIRLIELHRVLKPTGSLYLHCDPTASHYLKILLDAVFGARGFRTEISWKRSSAHNDARQGRVQYGNIRDAILFFTKSSKWTWNWQYTPYEQSYVEGAYRHKDVDGRRYRRDNYLLRSREEMFPTFGQSRGPFQVHGKPISTMNISTRWMAGNTSKCLPTEVGFGLTAGRI